MLTAENLPETGVQAYGAWILVFVEPLPELSKVVHLVRGQFDEGSELGVAWVLSADESYWDQHPDGEQKKAPDYSDKTCRMRMPVKHGDKVVFRRFLRSQGLMQGMTAQLRQAERDFPGYEAFFIHVNDLYGIVEDEPEGTTTHSNRPIS